MEDTSKQEILAAVYAVAEKIDDVAVNLNVVVKRVDGIGERVDTLEEAVQSLAQHLDERFEAVDRRFVRIESQMVTKSYLDEKLGDLKGDMIAFVRREDAKIVEKLS